MQGLEQILTNRSVPFSCGKPCLLSRFRLCTYYSPESSGLFVMCSR